MHARKRLKWEKYFKLKAHSNCLREFLFHENNSQLNEIGFDKKSLLISFFHSLGIILWARKPRPKHPKDVEILEC